MHLTLNVDADTAQDHETADSSEDVQILSIPANSRVQQSNKKKTPNQEEDKQQRDESKSNSKPQGKLSTKKSPIAKDTTKSADMDQSRSINANDNKKRDKKFSSKHSPQSPTQKTL